MAQTKKRFNIIDLLIIIALIAVIAGVAIRYNLKDKITNSTAQDTVIVSFEIRDIKPTSADAMVAGDMFYIKSNESELGELLSIVTSDAEKYYQKDDGTMVLTYDTSRCDVKGEMKCKGAMTESGFMLDGTQYIGPNKELNVYSKHISVSIRIIGIREE